MSSPSSTTPELPARTFSLRWLGLAVLACLLLLNGYEVLNGLDFRDYDDLVRHALARAWVSQPYFLMGDGYWPTLPAIVRGAVLKVLAPVALPHPFLVQCAIRAVTLAYLWGCWRLLVAAVRLLDGGLVAALLLTSFFLFNGGTFHFAASAFSEPDCFFFFLAALVLTLRCVGEGNFSAGRIAWIGLALAPACLVRYEAWTFPVVFGGVLIYAARGAWRPWWRWSGLLIPALPIGAWLWFQYLRLGNPFNFLTISHFYSHGTVRLLRFGASALDTLLAFLAIHWVWVLLVFALGLAELYRRRRDTRFETLGPLIFLMLFWAIYRMWSQQMTLRFAWDAALLLGVPGALMLERLARSRSGRVWLVVLTVLNLAGFIWMTVLLEPFIRPGLRNFANEVQRQTAGRNILVCDYHGPEGEDGVQIFRQLIATDRLLLSDWVGAGQPLTAASLRQGALEFILTRRFQGALTSGTPLLVEPKSEWKLWRSSLNRPPNGNAAAKPVAR